MGRAGRFVIGFVMTLAGLFFLVAGSFGDDMWFPVRRHGALPPCTTPGMHHWETDPTGYLLAAMMWGLLIVVGVVPIAQTLSRRTPVR